MKIESSMLSLSASSSQFKTQTVSEQLKTWANGANPVVTDLGNEAGQGNNTFSDLLKSLEQPSRVASSNATGGDYAFEISQEDEDKITLLQRLIEALTGKKLEFYIPKKFSRRAVENANAYKNPIVVSQHATGPGAQTQQGWGIDYQKSVKTEESATMSFGAKGMVTTADGKQIKIDLSLNVSRSFISETNTSFKAGDALKDPLIVNFGSSLAELTGKKFSFDIDSDGHEENISFVKSGSGFLVYDKNKDGKINNGSELFGPSTGSGFMELSAFDDDDNGWIDEADAIYEGLQIWTKDENGQDQLFAIGQKGIGAIYLNAVHSAFELKDASNALQGKIQQSSIFLRENGTAGTIQHVDLSV
ncbi:MAG: hypothetical protein H7X94_02965 [Vallitaleaceae bacterium]|nr:hypothetical protein [Vallitaleaceae bacterium]